MEVLLIPAIQTVAVLIGCGRGLWRYFPAWTLFSTLIVCQSWLMQWHLGDWDRMAAIWSTFGGLLLLGLVDSVLELFQYLSSQYRRFQRDRWKWLAIPAVLGVLLGLLLVSERLTQPSDFYRSLFLAHSVVGSICGLVLLLGWIESIPVRLPMSLRTHLVLLTVYVGASTVAYANYLQASNQLVIRNLLMFVPPGIMLTWSLLLPSPAREVETKTEAEMPESTLEQIVGALNRLT
jgi:hypothetical protein